MESEGHYLKKPVVDDFHFKINDARISNGVAAIRSHLVNTDHDAID